MENNNNKEELSAHIKKLKEDLETLSSNKITELENKISAINNFYNNFFEGEQSLEWKVRDIEYKINQSEDKYEWIEGYYSELFEWDDENNSVKQEILSLIAELNWYKEKNIEINKYYSELFEWDESIKRNINDLLEKVDNYKQSLFEWDESLENKVNNLIEKIQDYEEKYNSIIEYYNELLEWDEENDSIKNLIHGTYLEIKKYKTELLEWVEWNKSTKEKITHLFNEIKEYYDSIFWIKEENDDTWKVITKWVKWYKEKLDNLYNTKNTEYSELKNRIETLLPWATSAWLSSAYKDMKDSFFWWNIIWNFLFFLSLLLAIYIWKDIKVWDTLEKTLLDIIAHLPIILPLIWLAYFSSKQQSQNKRLQQEYAHKESLAKSFEWYKEQIDNLWEDEKSIEIKKLLMENIVKMTWENPSDTLDKNHWTNPPIWEYIFWTKDK